MKGKMLEDFVLIFHKESDFRQKSNFVLIEYRTDICYAKMNVIAFIIEMMIVKDACQRITESVNKACTGGIDLNS